jgi:hypothetical protein
VKQNESKPQKFEKISSLEHDSTHSKDGVDLSLIQWMLSITPTERLQVLQQNIRSIMRLRGDKPHT